MDFAYSFFLHQGNHSSIYGVLMKTDAVADLATFRTGELGLGETFLDARLAKGMATIY